MRKARTTQTAARDGRESLKGKAVPAKAAMNAFSTEPCQREQGSACADGTDTAPDSQVPQILFNKHNNTGKTPCPPPALTARSVVILHSCGVLSDPFLLISNVPVVRVGHEKV